MNIDRVLFAGAWALACGLLGGNAARADTGGLGDLSAGGYVQEFNYAGYNLVHPLNGAGSAAIGRAFVDIATAPGGAVLVSTPSGTPNAFFATGEESYYAEIVGPTADNIPLRLYFDMSVRGGAPSSYNSASITFYTTFSQVTLHNSDPPQAGASYLLQYVSTDTALKISLAAASEYGGTAYVDPMLEIDPAWALANPGLASQLSVSLSSGVENGLGDLAGIVPEPASWALMVVGCGLVSGLERRRAKKAIAA